MENVSLFLDCFFTHNGIFGLTDVLNFLDRPLSRAMYNHLLGSCLALNCTGNNTEDKITEHSFGDPNNEGLTTSPPTLKCLNDESQGGHLSGDWQPC